MLQKNDVPPKPLQTIQQPELEEVDLHAEMLVEDVRKLSAGELLELQMSRFTATLENALVSKRKGRIVFIHGIGSGKLKQEIRQCLIKNYPEISFQDASFREYGYGATMVFLG
jgi:dsDNA-specific endonuclease/ATPase MutS2